MSLVMRKRVFGSFRPGQTQTGHATEASMRFEILVTETRNITLFRQRTTKALIRLRGSAGWSAPLLFAYDIRHVFSWPGSYRYAETELPRYAVSCPDSSFIVKYWFTYRLHQYRLCYRGSQRGFIADLYSILRKYCLDSHINDYKISGTFPSKAEWKQCCKPAIWTYEKSA